MASRSPARRNSRRSRSRRANTVFRLRPPARGLESPLLRRFSMVYCSLSNSNTRRHRRLIPRVAPPPPETSSVVSLTVAPSRTLRVRARQRLHCCSLLRLHHHHHRRARPRCCTTSRCRSSLKSRRLLLPPLLLPPAPLRTSSSSAFQRHLLLLRRRLCLCSFRRRREWSPTVITRQSRRRGRRCRCATSILTSRGLGLFLPHLRPFSKSSMYQTRTRRIPRLEPRSSNRRSSRPTWSRFRSSSAAAAAAAVPDPRKPFLLRLYSLLRRCSVAC